MNKLGSVLESKVQAESIKLLYVNSQRVIPFNIFLITITVFLLWDKVNASQLLMAWFSLIIISLVRLLHIRFKLHKTNDWERDAPSLTKQFAVGVFLTSILWSIIFIVFSYKVSELYEFFMLWIMGGLIAGSIVSLNNNKLSFYLFMSPMILTTFLWYLLQFNKDGFAVSIVIILFAINIIIAYMESHKLLRQNIILQFEKDNLITSISRANERIKIISQTDELTRIPNRRYIMSILEKETRRACRDETPLSVAMVDVDNFKLYNDHYGHIAGDSMGRYGGEEFLIIMPNTDKNGSKILADRLREKVEKANIIHDYADKGGIITTSIGITTVHSEDLADAMDLINQADKALYMAKEKGRNCIVLIDDECDTSKD